MLEKLKRKVYSFMLKRYIATHEKQVSDGKNHLKYLPIRSRRNQCKTLLISFSGFAPRGSKPTYNYIRTLDRFSENKLFLLDDCGLAGTGSYYLGDNGDYFMVRLVSDLINVLINEWAITKVICLGSSKGGSSALMYGILNEADTVVIGSPQYYVGDYLDETEYRAQIMERITGKVRSEAQNELNQLLPDLINSKRTGHKPDVYLHYSVKEPAYAHHVANLIPDLRKNGFHVFEDVHEYLEHADVAKEFPKFLQRTLDTLLPQS